MKRVLVCVGALGCLTLAAYGQNYGLIKQHAKDVTDQGNTHQAAPAPAGPAPVAPVPVVSRPSLQQQNIARLKADLAAIHREGKLSDEAKLQFSKDLLAAAQGTGRPSAETRLALADHLLNSLAAKGVSTAADDKVLQKMVVLLNCAGLSSTRLQELADESQAALQSAGVPAEAAARIAADLHSLATEVQQTSRP